MLTTLLQSLASRIGAFWTSAVRTVAPMFVGWVVAQLLELGIAIDKDDQNLLTEILVIAAAIVWYLIARAFETLGTKFGLPALTSFGGFMLGLPAPPSYTSTSTDTAAARAPPVT